MDPESLDRERVESLGEALMSDFRRMGVDGHTAEDMIQEAWLRTLKGRRRPERLEAWLRVVGPRLLVEFARKGRSRRDHEREAGRRETWSAPPSSLDSKILRLLDELPAPYAEVVRLRYVEDEEVAEIAQHLQRSEATIRSQLKRGLQRLRARIEDRSGPERWSLLPVMLLRRAGRLFEARPRREVGLALGTLTAIALIGFLSWPRPVLRVEAASESYARAPSSVPPTLIAPFGERSPFLPLGPPEPATRELDSLARAAAGIVRTPDGAPLPGSQVFRGPFDGSRSELVATADELGRFFVARVEVSEFLWATHPDFLSSPRVHVQMSPEEQAVDLQLEVPAGRLTLSLRDSRGLDLARLPVELDWDRAVDPDLLLDGNGAVQTPTRSISGITDLAGRIVLPTPPRGQARLRVSRGSRARLSRVLDLVPGEQTLDLTLDEPPILSGLVLDARGRPAGRARVEALQDDGHPCAQTRTDELGRFSLAGLEPAACELRAVEDPARGTDSAVMDLHLGPDGAADTLLELSPRLTVRGRATRSGAPLGGARVARIGGLGEDASATTDAEGTFSFPCSVQDEYALALYMEGNPWPVRCLEGVRPGEEPVELTLDAAPALAALVLEFVNEDPALVPSMVELGMKTLGIGKSIIRPVDRANRRCELSAPAGEDVVLLVWIPGLGSLNLGRWQLEHDEVRPILIPKPALITFLVEFPDDVPNGPIRARLTRTGFGNPIFERPHDMRAERELSPGPDDCTFTARVLPGRYFYSFTADGLTYGRAPFEARAGATQTEIVRFTRSVPVEVGVRMKAGERLPFLRLVKSDGETSPYYPRETRREGGWAFFLVEIPPDVVAINASSETRFGNAPVVLERLTREAPTRIEIELRERDAPGNTAGSSPSGPK